MDKQASQKDSLAINLRKCAVSVVNACMFVGASEMLRLVQLSGNEFRISNDSLAWTCRCQQNELQYWVDATEQWGLDSGMMSTQADEDIDEEGAVLLDAIMAKNWLAESCCTLSKRSIGF